jgi:hypothetical protein
MWEKSLQLTGIRITADAFDTERRLLARPDEQREVERTDSCVIRANVNVAKDLIALWSRGRSDRDVTAILRLDEPNPCRRFDDDVDFRRTLVAVREETKRRPNALPKLHYRGEIGWDRNRAKEARMTTPARGLGACRPPHGLICQVNARVQLQPNR